MRIVCIVNPGRKRAAEVRATVLRHASALGLPSPLMMETTRDQPGEAQAAQALEFGADVVIGAGGDGTIRNIGSVLANSGVPLGIIPIGTANIFHLNALGRPRGIDRSVRTALLGRDLPIDLGNVSIKQLGGETTRHRCLVLVGMGRDAMTIMTVSETWKRRVGPLAYFAAGVHQVTQHAVPMRIEIDGRPLPHTDAWSVLVSNCGHIPGKIAVIPGARVDDGLLNVLHVNPEKLWQWVPIGVHGFRKTERSVRGLTESTAREATIIPDQPLPVQIDGDIWTDVIRLDIEIDPGALLIRVPQEVGDARP